MDAHQFNLLTNLLSADLDMRDTRMRKGLKAPEIIVESLQLLGTAKPFFTHGGDWFRGGSAMHKHLYHFAHSVVRRLTP